MVFDDAVEVAERLSAKHACTVYVNGRIRVGAVGPGLYDPYLDEDGWTTSDWFVDGSTVLKVHNGQTEPV